MDISCQQTYDMPWCKHAPVHDEVIKWKHLPRYWTLVRGIYRSPVHSPNKSQRRGALMFSLVCAWINGWINNLDVSELRSHRAHYDVFVMSCEIMRHYLRFYLLIANSDSLQTKDTYHWDHVLELTKYHPSFHDMLTAFIYYCNVPIMTNSCPEMV